MSSNGAKRVRRPEHYAASKREPWEPGDEREGDWPRERLIQMDADFVAAMQPAIERGLERRPDGERPVQAA
jgi:hypothetical protein